MRLRQIKNMLATLLLSQGVPMLLAGRRVPPHAAGNNNAYCQDNAITWFDWKLVEKNADLVRFTSELIAFRNGSRPCAAPISSMAGQLHPASCPT